MKKQSDAERSRRWRDRLKERGLVEVKVLIPEEKRNKIQEIAKSMRDIK